jgi:hypothetical protein
VYDKEFGRKSVKMAAKTTRVVYQFKVTLRDVQPPVWRRIQLWEDSTLGQLHRILQIVMGWEDCHLHQFKIGQSVYSVPDPDDPFGSPGIINENRNKIQDAVQRVGTQFDYWYDFGDDWQHQLLLEAIMLPEPRVQYPRCLAGERSAPPEDVGGPSGYADYLLQGSGRFDPEAFSLDDVNRQLHKAFRAASSTAAAPASPQNRPN